jgi:hypothetical protein
MILARVKIINARLEGAGDNINLSRSVTYAAANHRNILVKDCEVADGSVTVSGCNEVQINNNTLLGSDPSILLAMGAGMTEGEMMEIVNNKLFGDQLGTTNAIDVQGVSGGTMRQLLVAHNRTRFIGRHGLRLNPNTGVIEGALVHDNHIYDSSTQAGQHNLNDGIILEAGCVQSLVHTNQIIGTIVGLLQRYGVNEVVSGSSRDNHMRNNVIKGYGTADILSNTNTGSSGLAITPDFNIDLGAAP